LSYQKINNNRYGCDTDATIYNIHKRRIEE
jgi:hypothetical protein